MSQSSASPPSPGRLTTPGRAGGPATSTTGAVGVLPGGPTVAAVRLPDLPAPGDRATVRGRLGRLLAGSPGQLRIAAAVSVLACLLLALGGAAALQSRAAALESARTHAAQVVRVQKAGADLVRADAAVSNGFLAGGAEPVRLTAEYETAIATASRLLVDAAAAEPADRVQLAQAVQLLADYSRQIAHARDNNRLNLPLGSGYLVLGSQTTLRDQLLPLLDAVVTVNAEQVDSAYTSSMLAGLWFVVVVVVSGGLLIGVQVWLARRTRRRLNVGLVAASAAVLLAVGLGGIVLSSTGSTANDVRDNAYRVTDALATARAAAYSAKGLESLTLVKQGGGAAYETRWKTERDRIDAALTTAEGASVPVSAARTALGRWSRTHALIRSLDDGGDWPTAVVVATRDRGAATPAAAEGRASNADFAAFVAALDPVLDGQSAAVSSRLASTWAPLQAAGWAILGLGVLAAAAAVAGISRRLGEYR